MALRYAVGAGTWNSSDTTIWSETSGGTTGASVPGIDDDVILDGNTGALTISLTNDIKTLDATAYTGTLSGSGTRNVFGNITLSSGISFGGLMKFQLRKTTTGNTADFAGLTLPSILTVDCDGGDYTIQNLAGLTGNFVVEAGEAILTASTFACSTFDINAGTVRLLSGSDTTLTCNNVLVETAATITNSERLIIETTSVSNFRGGGKTYKSLTMSGTATGAKTFDAGNIFTGAFTLPTFTGGTADSVVLDGALTCGTLSLSGASATAHIIVRAADDTQNATITAGTVSISNASFRCITGAGAGNWDLSATRAGDFGGNTDIDFPTPITMYWYQNGGTLGNGDKIFLATGGAGGAARVPLPQDTLVFDNNSFTGNGNEVFIDIRLWPNIDTRDLTLYTFLLTTTQTPNRLSKEYHITTAVSDFGTASHDVICYNGDDDNIIDITCTFVDKGMVIDCSVGTYTLANNYTTVNGRSITITSGRIALDGYILSTGTVVSTASGVKQINANGGSFVPYGNGNVWNCSGSGMVIEDKLDITFTNNSTNSKTFNGGGYRYGIISVDVQNTGSFTFSGTASSYLDVSVGFLPRTLLFTAGQTFEFRRTPAFMTEGGAGTVVTLASTTTSSYTFRNPQRPFAQGDYVSVSRCTVDKGLWYLGANSTDGGNNVNWNFNQTPPVFTDTITLTGA